MREKDGVTQLEIVNAIVSLKSFIIGHIIILNNANLLRDSKSNCLEA